MPARKKKWMQEAFSYHKKCSLHRQLKIPCEVKIPITLLRKIKGTEIGLTVLNPTKTGKRRIKVTRLLKYRANLAHTARTKTRLRVR